MGGFGGTAAMAFAPDGRIFICERTGKLLVIKNGQLLLQPFLTVPALSNGERGLLSVAFDPNFATNGFVYIYYTSATTGNNTVSRFTASTGDPDRADPTSELVLLDVSASAQGYHNGGALHFGNDGFLYIGVGDGHSSSNAQDLSTRQGKLLRIDPHSFPNIVPPGNPFVGTAGALGEIWAQGLRNPFTFAVDPVTGVIHINDVGEAAFEEVNLGIAGSNYGWPTCEGACAVGGLTNPLYAYGHAGNCAVTGGAFYRSNQFPTTFTGAYFFADWCGGWLKILRADNSVEDFLSNLSGVIDLDVGPDGGLYLLTNGGALFRIVYVGGENRAPAAMLAADQTSGPAPLSVVFSAAGSSDPDNDPLTYAWSFGDGTPVGSGLTLTHVFQNPGTFTAQLTVDDGQGATGTAMTTITVTGSTPPVATIVSPMSGTMYRGGDTVQYSGSGTDAEDGVLPASGLSWTIQFHHDQHFHPFLGPINGVSSGALTIPQVSELSANVWFRMLLTATDSSGATHQATRDVHPHTSTFTVTTQPPGLQVTIDGVPQTAPHAVLGVEGVQRVIAVSPAQMAGQALFVFDVWSDGGAASHAISTPTVDTTYTATFIPSGFTDDPLVPEVTTIRVVHIMELRARIDALLASAAVWTDDPIIAGTTVIKAMHLLELQVALDQAHTEQGATHAPYTALGVGGQILAAHIAELRLFLAALE